MLSTLLLDRELFNAVIVTRLGSIKSDILQLSVSNSHVYMCSRDRDVDSSNSTASAGQKFAG